MRDLKQCVVKVLQSFELPKGLLQCSLLSLHHLLLLISELNIWQRNVS